MDDKPVTLDDRRGMMAQRETAARRMVAGHDRDKAESQERRADRERCLTDEPARTWRAAAEKAEHLVALFAETREGRDPGHVRLIASLRADMAALAAADGEMEAGGTPDTKPAPDA